MSINLVKEIYYKNNVLIIDFLEDMKLYEEDGITNLENYKINIDNESYLLSSLAIEDPIIIGNKAILVKLDRKLTKENKLTIGYMYAKTLRVVKSAEGIIQNICENYNNFSELESINLENSYGSIINERKILVEYKGNNMWGRIFKRDFYVNIQGRIYYSSACLVEDNYTLYLEFDEDIFNSSQENVCLSLVEDPISMDIIEGPLLGGKKLFLKNNIDSFNEYIKNDDLNLVKEILYKNNLVLINFNEDMEMSGEYGILNINNYALMEKVLHPDNFNVSSYGAEITSKRYPLKSEILLNPIVLSNRTIIFYLKKDFKEYGEILIGYMGLKKIYHVKSLTEKIHCVCSREYNKRELEDIKISNSYGSIIDSKTVLLEYKGNNIISRVEPRDFYVEIRGEKYSAESYTLDKQNIVYLRFRDGVFKNIGNVILRVEDIPQSKDIVNENIIGRERLALVNLLDTKIENLSILSNDSGEIALRLKFTRNLLTFDMNDFTILFKDKPIEVIRLEKASNEENSVEIAYINLFVRPSIFEIGDVFIDGTLKIISSGDIDDVTTLDINKDKVYDLVGKTTKILRVERLEVDLPEDSIKNGSFKVTFNRQIDSTIFYFALGNDENYLDNVFMFPENYPLPEDRYTLSPGEVRFDRGLNSDFIRFKEKEELGEFEFKRLNNIISGYNIDITNECEVIVEVIEESIFIKFNENETFGGQILAGTFMSTDKLIYHPSSKIIGKDGTNIYNWTPWSKYNKTSATLYIPPLSETVRNPFTGGVVRKNYIIELSKNNKNRTYGVEQPTKIIGNITLIGEVEGEEEVILKNLNVEGDITINATGGKLVLDEGYYNNINVNSKL